MALYVSLGIFLLSRDGTPMDKIIPCYSLNVRYQAYPLV